MVRAWAWVVWACGLGLGSGDLGLDNLGLGNLGLNLGLGGLCVYVCPCVV